jgi:hypothetical protein
MHVGPFGGTAPEDSAPHRGAEINMPMDKLKWVDVPEYRAKQRNLFHKVDHFAKIENCEPCSTPNRRIGVLIARLFSPGRAYP